MDRHGRGARAAGGGTVVAGLQAAVPPLRWGLAAASLGGQPGRREQAAVIDAAVEALAEGTLRRSPITVRTGAPGPDALIADLASALPALLAGLTDRQREAGRLLLIDGLRRSEIAATLRISRPTVSVMVDRARLLELNRLARGLDEILRTSVARTGGAG